MRQASLNAASTSNSSRGWSLEDDDDAIINSICSNPALLKRLNNMLDSVESSVSPESTNNASEISNAISSTLRHPSDRQKDQSKAVTCGLIEQLDSVSHGMMLFELGQEARVFLLETYCFCNYALVEIRSQQKMMQSQNLFDLSTDTTRETFPLQGKGGDHFLNLFFKISSFCKKNPPSLSNLLCFNE